MGNFITLATEKNYSAILPKPFRFLLEIITIIYHHNSHYLHIIPITKCLEFSILSIKTSTIHHNLYL